MNIIHIASFKGNIGDAVNHNGLYKLLRIDESNVEKVELREFYFSLPDRREFDLDFADHINDFDLCIIGGGNYFDIKWERSHTGTTLDMSDAFLDAIKIPILINAIGLAYDVNGKTQDHDIMKNKFIRFLGKLNEKHAVITFRNDGSFERLQKIFNVVPTDAKIIPDPGFDCDYGVPITNDRTYIGLCLTNDLFKPEYNNGITTEVFNKRISMFVRKLLDKGEKIILFPHIPNDIKVIEIILRTIPELQKRTNVVVAPYDASSSFCVKQLGFYYSKCKHVIGMRLHSLITCINLSIPSIALCGHLKIQDLFHYNKLDDYLVKVDNIDFNSDLESKVDWLQHNFDKELAIYNQIKRENRRIFDEYSFKVNQLLQNKHSTK